MTTPLTQNHDLEVLRAEMEQINQALLDLLSRRAEVATAVQRIKTRDGIPTHVPEREQAMLRKLVSANKGPFSHETVTHLFQEIFHASVGLMEEQKQRVLKISRAARAEDLEIQVGADATIGGMPVLIAGPCSIESEEQMEEVARALVAQGVRFLRGGAFKPRSSPYAFQGLGLRGLQILKAVGQRYGLKTVTEVMDTRSVELTAEHADILQIGSRNMHNYDLLREVGKCRRPVLLKRGLAATIEEWLWSAEYIVHEGNQDVVLCERGIRTFETETRNTLDISAVPLVRLKSYLPVIVDVSHAAGRKDILAALGRAALAAGASGLMVETHPCPAVARSDAQQQLDFEELAQFVKDVGLRREPMPLPASFLPQRLAVSAGA